MRILTVFNKRNVAWTLGIGILIVAIGVAYKSSNRDSEVYAHEIIVYKSPTCGCCTKWEDHLRLNGFRVISKPTSDLDSIKGTHSIPPELSSCHTGLIDGYVIEGHVPAASIRKLLINKPKGARGLTVPGMPEGSPGMEGPHPESYEVLSFNIDNQVSVFDRY